MTSKSYREQIRLQREQLRARYGSLLDDITAILFRHDPEGINFETNTDEYDPEARTILPRLEGVRSAADVQRVVREEFEHWFGGVRSDRDGRRDRAAAEIWKIWCEHRAQ